MTHPSRIVWVKATVLFIFLGALIATGVLGLNATHRIVMQDMAVDTARQVYATTYATYGSVDEAGLQRTMNLAGLPDISPSGDNRVSFIHSTGSTAAIVHVLPTGFIAFTMLDN